MFDCCFLFVFSIIREIGNADNCVRVIKEKLDYDSLGMRIISVVVG